MQKEPVEHAVKKFRGLAINLSLTKVQTALAFLKLRKSFSKRKSKTEYSLLPLSLNLRSMMLQVQTVITGNASNMQGAWKIIEEKYPHFFANGCGAHVMNLLIKDICELDRYKPILADVSFVVKLIRDRLYVLAKFNEFRKRFHISRNLAFSYNTLVYSFQFL